MTSYGIGFDDYKLELAPDPISIASSASLPICGGSSTTLTASSSTAYNYSWSPAQGLSSTSGATVTANPTATTTYTVTGTLGSITNSRTITVGVNPAPTNITLIETPVFSGGATQCDMDYVKLDIGTLVPVVTQSEGFENATDIFTADYSNTIDAAFYYNTAYKTEGLRSINFVGDASDGEDYISLDLTNSINLTNYSKAILTFDHICASEAGFDFGELYYSIDGGANWNSFPASAYLGSGTLKNGRISFDKSSYGDWNSVITGASSVPNNSLWKTENIDLTPFMTSTNFKVSFSYEFDDSLDYYGWLVDNIKINSTPKASWTPAVGLYTDSALTTLYTTDSNVTEVYAAPESSQIYTGTSSFGTCSKTVTSSSIIRTKKVFTGEDLVDSKSWDKPNNWSLKTVPTADNCVSIPSGKEVIVNVTNAVANLVTINAGGKLTVAETADSATPNVLTAKQGLQVATGGEAIFKNNAQLMQDEAATANNEGSIIAERDVTDMDNVLATQMDYIYWSSPVADQPTNDANAFSPGTDPAFFFDYKEADDIFYPTPDTAFQRGKGYAVGAEVGVAFPTGYDATYRFTGKPNNGAFNGQPLLKSATGGGYNLVGNPYPSNIDLDKLFALNSDRIASVAFMWVNTGIYTENQMGSGYAGNNYSVYNEAGGTPATAFSEGFNAPTKTIKVGQGFIVEALPAGNGKKLKFDHSVRVTDKGTGFYQKANEAAKNRFWLQHISPETVVNTMLVGYFDDATAGFDKNYDAELFSSPNDVIYSVLNNLKLLIQGKNIFNVNDKVSLGTNQNAVGNYRIKLAHKEGIFENGQAIYLHDKLNNTYTNLQETDFTYAATKGATVNRFEIVYEPSATLGTGANTKESIQVYRNGDNFVVKSGQSKIDEVEVFDASGRLFQKVKGGSVEVTIPAATLASGIYILKISRSNETISKKIIK